MAGEGLTAKKRPTLRTLALVVVLVALRLGLDASRLAANPRAYWNAEEAHTAGVAWYAWHAGMWDQLLNLQYKSFCGGCTVLGVLGAPVLGVAGDSFLAWKGIALAWTAATLCGTFVAVDRGIGRAAAWGSLVLLAVAPVGLSDVSLMLWGNHSESALFVAIGVWLSVRLGVTGTGGVGGWAALGLWLGVSFWFTRTFAYAAVVLIPLALWAMTRDSRGRPAAIRIPAFGLGLAAGAGLMAVPAARGDAGYYDLSVRANLFASGVHAGLLRGRGLFDADVLAGHLFRTLDGMVVETAGWLVGAAIAACFLLFRRPSGGRVWVAIAGAFAFFYCASAFPIADVGGHAGVIHTRYDAPWFYVLLVIGGVAAGVGIEQGGGRRALGVAVAVLMLGPSLAGWARSLRTAHLTPGITEIAAVNHADFASVAVWRFDDARLASAHSADAKTESWLRRMEGYRAAAAAKDGRVVLEGDVFRMGSEAAIEGFAQATTLPELWDATSGLNADATTAAQGRGMAWNLGFGLVDQDKGRARPRDRSPANAARAVADTVRRLRAGLSPDQPCRLCAAAGLAAIENCRQPQPEATTDCLTLAVAGLEKADSDEVLYGAGVFCVQPGAPLGDCEGIHAGTAFAAGVLDPMAGAEHPILLLPAGASRPTSP